MDNLSGYYKFLKSCLELEFLGWTYSVCFKNYRSRSCIDTSRFIWISCVVRVWTLRHPVWFGDLATSAGPLEGQWVGCEPCVAIYNNSNKVLVDNLPLISSRRNQRVWLWSLDDVESISCSMIYIYTHTIYIYKYIIYISYVYLCVSVTIWYVFKIIGHFINIILADWIRA